MSPSFKFLMIHEPWLKKLIRIRWFGPDKELYIAWRWPWEPKDSL